MQVRIDVYFLFKNIANNVRPIPSIGICVFRCKDKLYYCSFTYCEKNTAIALHKTTLHKNLILVYKNLFFKYNKIKQFTTNKMFKRSYSK